MSKISTLPSRMIYIFLPTCAHNGTESSGAGGEGGHGMVVVFQNNPLYLALAKQELPRFVLFEFRNVIEQMEGVLV